MSPFPFARGCGDSGEVRGKRAPRTGRSAPSPFSWPGFRAKYHAVRRGGRCVSPAEIQALRVRMGLTVDEFAERSGMTSEQVMKLESGRIKARGPALVQFRMLQDGTFTRPRPEQFPQGPARRAGDSARNHSAAVLNSEGSWRYGGPQRCWLDDGSAVASAPLRQNAEIRRVDQCVDNRLSSV